MVEFLAYSVALSGLVLSPLFNAFVADGATATKVSYQPSSSRFQMGQVLFTLKIVDLPFCCCKADCPMLFPIVVSQLEKPSRA